MLIKASYEGNKMKATHVERVDTITPYLSDLKKDPSNGFTKDRTMRRVAAVPYLTLLDYDKEHPGWLAQVMNIKDKGAKDKLWKEFLASDWAKPFMTVERMLHV